MSSFTLASAPDGTMLLGMKIGSAGATCAARGEGPAVTADEADG